MELADKSQIENLEDFNDSFYDKLDGGDFVTTPMLTDDMDWASFPNFWKSEVQELVEEAERLQWEIKAME